MAIKEAFHVVQEAHLEKPSQSTVCCILPKRKPDDQ